MKIRYTPAAREDLRELKAYLAAEFGASVAASSVARIVSDISALKRHRRLARPLSGKIGRETPYLYYLCGRCSIAIMTDCKGVYSILRILDGRTDYARTIFGNQDE